MTTRKVIKLPHSSPFREYLELEFTVIENGHTVCWMPIQKKHTNARGFLHGGAAFTMVDAGMGNALRSVLDAGHWGVTAEMNISYLNAASSGTLRCETTILRRSKRIAFLESEITMEDTLIAKASGTFAIIRRAADR